MCGRPKCSISHISCFYKTVNELQMSPWVLRACPNLTFPGCAFLLRERPDKMAVGVTWLSTQISRVKIKRSLLSILRGNQCFPWTSNVEKWPELSVHSGQCSRCWPRPVGAAGSPLVDSVPGGFQQCLTGACGYTERQASPSLQSAEPVIVWNRGNLGG